MAKATVLQPIAPYLTLELTKEEAQALADITDFIGGHKDTTRRGHYDNIAAALKAVGVVALDRVRDITGGIKFL